MGAGVDGGGGAIASCGTAESRCWAETGEVFVDGVLGGVIVPNPDGGLGRLVAACP